MLALIHNVKSIGTLQNGVLNCNDCCKHCFSLNLTTFSPKIPENVKPTITKIQFNDNWIHSIQTNVFANFSNCIELNMAYNFNSFLQSRAFSGMDSLRKLNLTGNQLIDLRSRHFMGPSALKELYLQSRGFSGQ